MKASIRWAAVVAMVWGLWGCSDSGPVAPGPDGGVPDVGMATDAVADAVADAEPEVVEGLAPFVYSTACGLPADPPSNTTVVLVDAFPALPISYPLLLTHANDGSNRLFVVERFGKIKVFPNDPAVAISTTYLDLSNSVATSGEGGLLGLAFHPDYADNGHVFVNYTVMQGGAMVTRVSRFTVSSADPDQADPQTEVVLLSIYQPYNNHDGGMIAFGPDGHLYVGMGDGGAGGDPHGHGQDTETLLGAMLRIDVDNPSGGENYGIPPDNPFVGGGGRAEIFAWGLRNPWRFSFDTLTGALWVGDVGQKTWEEISVVGLGENHGWNTMEGFDCYPPTVNTCNSEGMTPPIMQYPNAGKGSVTGGYVYRGARVPSLYGTYIFADYEQYSLYLLRPDESPPEGPALTTPDKIAGFGQDAEGEVYVLGLLQGTIYRLQDSGVVVPDLPSTTFPETLAATGCFTDLATLEPAAGVLPYELNLPFWSDGADKSRWMVLPEGGQIGFDAEGDWTVPEGTLFIKHFDIEAVAGDPTTAIRLETRFLVHEADGVRGYVYRWNDAGTEATLLPSGATRQVTVTDDEGPTDFAWQFPARHQCKSCHTKEAGGVLGLETAQLNRETSLHGPVDNQLAIWAEWEVFTEATSPADLATLPAHPEPEDAAAPLEERARSWLHVNCANCHRGAVGAEDMDLRWTTALGETAACDAEPGKGDLGITGAALLSPGAPDTSLLYRRVVAQAPYRMPPIASSRVDSVGGALIEAWIGGLTGCQ